MVHLSVTYLEKIESDGPQNGMTVAKNMTRKKMISYLFGEQYEQNSRFKKLIFKKECLHVCLETKVVEI